MKNPKKKSAKPRARRIDPENLTVADITAACHKLGIEVTFDLEPDLKFKPFALVWVEGKPSPTIRHETPKSAEDEAKRLALKEQRRAYVMFATCCVEPVPQRVKIGRPDIEIPGAKAT